MPLKSITLAYRPGEDYGQAIERGLRERGLTRADVTGNFILLPEKSKLLETKKGEEGGR